MSLAEPEKKEAQVSAYRLEAVESLATNKGAHAKTWALAYRLVAVEISTFQGETQSESFKNYLKDSQICICNIQYFPTYRSEAIAFAFHSLQMEWPKQIKRVKLTGISFHR